MKKIIKYLKNFFDISLVEAKGVLVLLIIITSGVLLTSFFSWFTLKRDSEIYIAEVGSTKLPETAAPEFKKSQFNKKTFKRFIFNPNTASENELSLLGFPKYTIKTLLNYRSKGGKFKYKEDLLKVYGLKPEFYHHISSLIDLPEKKLATFSNDTPIINELKENTEIKAKTPYISKSTLKFDINKADTSQLIKVKGIGKVFAQRIVKYRDALGGFYNLKQLSEVYGISPEALAELEKVALFESKPKTIKINGESIAKHPYLSYQQIKIIKAYKTQHGNFNSISDLEKVKVLDSETIQKLSPYLVFD